MEGMFDGTKALDLDPDCTDALISRARCCLSLGDLQGVLEDAKLVISLHGGGSVGFELSAEVKLQQGDYAGAHSDASFATLCDDQNQRAHEIIDLAIKASRRAVNEHNQK
jgi:isopentenyl phosphate kinase